MYFDLYTIRAKNRLRLLGQLITISQIFRTKRLEDFFILYLQITPPLATTSTFLFFPFTQVMFQVRKDGFKDNPAVPEELDLVEEEDQFTHMITLDDATTGRSVMS